MLLAATITLLAGSCAKADSRGYSSNDCRTCRAYYESNLPASEPKEVCSDEAENNFRQEYNYAGSVECKK